MKFLNPIESIPTDQIIKIIENGFVVFFCFGFFGGMTLLAIATSGFGSLTKTLTVSLAITVLLVFLLFYSIYTRSKIVPELKRRLKQKECP
jgi:succinate dehydrogenase/fumarate reductase cytochrome b subunit